MTTPDEWAELCGALPDHASEVMASHEGRPTVETQSATHGAPQPAEDRGMSSEQKYGGAA